MGPSKEVIKRAVHRVAYASTSEAIGRAINVALPFAVLSTHDASTLTDSFFMAMAIAFFVQGTIANALTSALLQTFSTQREQISLLAKPFWAITAATASALSTIIMSPAAITTNLVISAISVFVISCAGLISAIATAALYSSHHYTLPGITWGIRTVPILFYLFWHPNEPELHWLLAGIAIADTIRAAILLWETRQRFHLGKNGVPLHLPISALHLIFASAIIGIIPIATRLIASFGEAGTISLFEIADRLYGALASSSTIGVSNVVLVYLANLKHTHEENSGWTWIIKAAIVWSLLWLAISIILWSVFPVFTPWLGLETHLASQTTRNTYLALAIGIPGFIITNFIGRKLITMGASYSLIPMAITSLSATCILSVLLSHSLGIVGIGIAITISQYIIAMMMIYTLNHHPHTAPQ